MTDSFAFDSPSSYFSEEKEEVAVVPEAEVEEAPAVDPAPKSVRKPRKPVTRRPRVKPIDAILSGIALSKELESEDSDLIDSLASILGVEADVAHVAASIASGAKADTSVFDTLTSIRQADNDFAAGIMAHQLTEDRKKFNAAWNLVRSIDASMDVEPPRSSTDAASKFASACMSLSDDEVSRLTRPLEILNR